MHFHCALPFCAVQGASPVRSERDARNRISKYRVEQSRESHLRLFQPLPAHLAPADRQAGRRCSALSKMETVSSIPLHFPSFLSISILSFLSFALPLPCSFWLECPNTSSALLLCSCFRTIRECVHLVRPPESRVCRLHDFKNV
ncbi:hypothetical protein MPTK1_5g09380 [Marchantia polymorpha subsp. ruderalis]|uniref:Uncharacterized protein n=2 Tax=Marchantia polymorpha TaxID=3197 RepID=A0AAF6BGK4_MARPO|nr:hypothetical protein MARPO_0095s0022 [Marchantia polymorpha]BBN11138.1 hypothetical protein Mp_5g09380 [Marchantia polymorpha subsp. ruderalis]|eukprot:PTQ32760.1 hypothetical protein MARPO_0095s0022 [Marchantia polymorpha]